MIRYLIRRIVYAVPILLGVSLVTFFLFFIAISPNEMARRQLGKNPTSAQIHGWLAQHGYDKPVAQQFVSQVGRLCTFQFGTSDVDNEPIWTKIKRGAGPSGEIGFAIFLGSLIASVSAALVVAYYRGTYIDQTATFLLVLMMSIVYMLWITGIQFLFGKLLHLGPINGWQSGWASLRFLGLPLLIGILTSLGGSVRFYRTMMLDEIGQDYVRTARAKGVGERAILFRHVLKNAMIPIITSTVLGIPFIILGNLLIESFFGIPGLGGITVDAINSQDFAVVRAMVFLG
ncbi:MAG: ABC transporter permease, partial [Armatimonadota bacterium]|nr:ABC transporter permease [Armatimonadota bacterium]